MTPKNLQQLYRSIPRQMQAIIYAGKAYTSYQNEITEFVWCIWASYWTYLLTAAFLLAKIVYAKPRKKSQTHTVSLTSFLTILRLTIPPMKSKFYDATLPICWNNKKGFTFFELKCEENLKKSTKAYAGLLWWKQQTTNLCGQVCNNLRNLKGKWCWNQISVVA